MAEDAAAPADEQAQATLGGGRVAGPARGVVLRQGVAKIVERRAAGDQGFDKRRQRLAEIDEDPFVVRAQRCAECLPVGAGEAGVRTDQTSRARRPDTHFALVQKRPQILRPQIILRAVPAEPAVETQVEQAEGVAVDRPVAPAARPSVRPALRRPVAGGAGDRSGDRQTRVEEQHPPERNGGRLARNPVARIDHDRRRPRPLAQDATSFFGSEVDGLRRNSRGDSKYTGYKRRSGQIPGLPDATVFVGAPPTHSSTISAVSFSRPAGPAISRMSCHRPGM